jgi:hypothetical protein
MESFHEEINDYKPTFYERNREAIIFYSIAGSIILFFIIPWIVGWFTILI